MFWHLVARLEWRNDDGVGRRHELYARAAPIFRKHGYAGTTLKALARACELSIPALYRYFPSKKAFALFPLMALYPELHAGNLLVCRGVLKPPTPALIHSAPVESRNCRQMRVIAPPESPQVPAKAGLEFRLVGRGFRNANRIEIAGTKMSLHVRSPPTADRMSSILR